MCRVQVLAEAGTLRAVIAIFSKGRRVSAIKTVGSKRG